MEQKANFSDADTKTIADALNDLKEVCLPLPHEITTTTQIHAPTSAVSLSSDRYDTIQDLRTMAYLGMLPDNIHMIKTGDTCWFYSDLDPSDFYSDKANIYVVFGTQQPSDPAILKNKQIKKALKDMLWAAASNPKISEQELNAYFTPQICQKIYELNPPREHILFVLMTSMAQIRDTLCNHFINNHWSYITKQPSFKRYVQEHNAAYNEATALNYLQEKHRIFIWAHKFGYTRSTQKLIRHQEERDIPRHTKKFMPDPFQNPDIQLNAIPPKKLHDFMYHRGYPLISPKKLYTDIADSLTDITTPKSANKKKTSYDDATRIIWEYPELEELKSILTKYQKHPKSIEKILQTYFAEYIQPQKVTIVHPNKSTTEQDITYFRGFYVKNKGITWAKGAPEDMTQQPVLNETAFHNLIHNGNIVAHAGNDFRNQAVIVSEDLELVSDFVSELSQIHEQKQQAYQRHEIDRPIKQMTQAMPKTAPVIRQNTK